MKAALLFVLALSSCKWALTPRPTPPPGAPADACLADDAGAMPGSCGNKLTSSEGYPCAACELDYSCIDKTAFVYCVGPLGCDDPHCAER